MPIFIRIIMSLVFVLGILVMAFTFSDLRIFDLVDSSGLERILMVIMSYEQIIQYPVSYTHLTLPTKRIV